MKSLLQSLLSDALVLSKTKVLLLSKAEILLLSETKVLLLSETKVLLLSETKVLLSETEVLLLSDDGLLLSVKRLSSQSSGAETSGGGKTTLRADTLGSSLVTLSLWHHSPLLVLEGLLVEEVSSVNIVALRANGGHISGLRARAVALSLLSVLLSLSQVATSLPLGSLHLESLSLLVEGKSLISVLGMDSSVGVWEVQSRIEATLLNATGSSEGLLLESLLQSLLLETLLLESLLLDVGSTLVDNLVSVDGGLHDVLGEMLLRALDHRDDSLAVDDGLNLIYNIGVNLLLHDGLVLVDTSLSRGSLVVVLLDVVDDVLVYLTMKNGLYLNHSVVTDGLLNDGCRDVGSGVLDGLLHHSRGGSEGSSSVEYIGARVNDTSAGVELVQGRLGVASTRSEDWASSLASSDDGGSGGGGGGLVPMGDLVNKSRHD